MKKEERQVCGAQKGNPLQSTSIPCCSWAEGLWDIPPPRNSPCACSLSSLPGSCYFKAITAAILKP